MSAGHNFLIDCEYTVDNYMYCKGIVAVPIKLLEQSVKKLRSIGSVSVAT